VARPVEWGIAARDRPGERISGDHAVVSLLAEGALVVAIDGLGHGDEAASAARTAAEIVRTSPTHDLVTLLQACHVGLRGTRGAAISLAFLSAADGGLTWLGVGSVEGRVLSGDPSSRRPKGSLPLAAGIPGHHLPEVSTATLAVTPGDVLVLATDGIDADFADALDTSGSTQAISERILADHGRRPDDALVVVVRYLGERS
jgi:hypothetical protein